MSKFPQLRSKIAMKDATYAFQKDAYADLDFLNDVGYLPDGTATRLFRYVFMV